MAQPSYAIEYLGAVEVTANKTVNLSDIHIKYPTATVLKIKTDGVSVSVAGSPMFMTSFDDESFVPTSTSRTYIFDKDCIIAVGKYVAI